MISDRFKFRAYVKVNEEIELVDTIEFDEDCIKWNVAPIVVGGCGRTFDEVILMQCTGLKDKNGKLIYEGDILKEIYDDIDYGKSEDIIKVEYSPILAAFIMTRKNYKSDITMFDEVDLNNFEVIGNIYENEELI